MTGDFAISENSRRKNSQYYYNTFGSFGDIEYLEDPFIACYGIWDPPDGGFTIVCYTVGGVVPPVCRQLQALFTILATNSLEYFWKVNASISIHHLLEG